MSVGRAAVGMGAITAVSRALGFVRVLVVAAVLGTTYLGNAFQAANSLSNVLFELLAAGALSAVLVPTFVKLLDAGDDQGAEDVAGGVLGVALIVLGGVTVVGIVAAPLIAELFTLGVPADVAAEQQELITFLVRWFVPQVLLYAAGTVATAVLYAKRRFAITAAAPIGNTVVMVAALAAFWMVAGPDPGLDLSTTERALLVVAGTGGVIAFVGSLLVACRASGFRLRPQAAPPRPAGGGHAPALGLGRGPAHRRRPSPGGGHRRRVGGRRRRRRLPGRASCSSWRRTACWPSPSTPPSSPTWWPRPRDGGEAVFAASMRWALERMSLLVVPVSAGMMALALPGMRAVSAGATDGEGVTLLAAAVASLAVGLLPYSAFLLLARGYYALGDSRTPGVIALVAAAVGVVVMLGGVVLTEGAARVAALGIGHSAAYLAGAVVLGARLARRLGASLVPAGVWAGSSPSRRWSASRPGSCSASSCPPTPPACSPIVVVAAIGVAGAGVVLAGLPAAGCQWLPQRAAAGGRRTRPGPGAAAVRPRLGVVAAAVAAGRARDWRAVATARRRPAILSTGC